MVITEPVVSAEAAMRKCKKCGKVKPLDDFNKNARLRQGRTWECKTCCNARIRSWKSKHRKRVRAQGRAYHQKNKHKLEARRQARRLAHPERQLVESARRRAREMGLPFDLTANDVKIPVLCPALGIPIRKGNRKLKDNSPSIDRLIPRLGYVKGNVVVVSWRANRIKCDATLDEMRRLLSFYETVLC